MAILITGAGGLIGSRLMEISRSEGLTGLSRKVGFDLADHRSLSECLANFRSESIDAIVHLAAFTNVSEAHRQAGDREGECYQVNVAGTEQIARFADEMDAHLIYISTDFVFDGKKPEPFDESTKPSPIEWYGETKLLGEEAVKKYSDNWTIVRVSFPYLKSEGVRPDLVSTIRSKLRQGLPLHLFGDQMITPTFGDDIVNGIDLLLKERTAGEIFHVMGPESMSPYDLGTRLAGLMGIESPDITKTSLEEYLAIDPRPRQKYSVANTEKYRSFSALNDQALPLTVEEALR